MEFLYFAEAPNTKAPEEARAIWGGEFQPTPRDCYRFGREGKTGRVFAGGQYWKDENSHLIGYFPDRQEWLQIPGTTYWIGWYPENPPVPQDFIRPEIIPGHRVKLGDGNHWEIPVVTSCETGKDGQLLPVVCLPRSMTLDEKGRWKIGGVMGKHRTLFEIAEKWWNNLIQAYAEADEADSEAVIYLDETADWSLLALSCNYRIGKWEAFALELFNEYTMADTLNAIVDKSTWLRRLNERDDPKKKDTQSATLSSNDGNAV